MKNDTDLFDISAEFLLNYLYPDRTDSWQVDCAGTFYRNYSPDLLSVDEEGSTVRLARDSFLRLLPQGVIAPDNALKGKDFEQKYERLKKKEELLRELFKPVDTLAFRFRLHIGKEAARLSRDRLAFLLKRYYGYDPDREENPYVRRTAPLLLFASHLRGDFGFIRNLLEQLFGCRVTMETGRYAWDEGAECSQPSVAYSLVVPGLTAEAYNALMREVAPLADFISEWFVPFDTRCTVCVRHPDRPFVLDGGLTLDYNTGISEQSSTQNIDTESRNTL